MKIAHVADVHWGLNYPGPSPDARFKDICQTMDWIADRIIEEGCDLVVFCGDAFKDARVFLERASVEITAFVSWLKKLDKAGIDTVVISGTPSHDAVAAYGLIKQMLPAGEDTLVYTVPAILDYCGLDIAVLPGLNRSQIASKEEYSRLAPHELHQLMTQKITQIAQGLLSKIKEKNSIGAFMGSNEPLRMLLSHITYVGADKGFEDMLMQHEPVLTREAIQGFDLVCLGHIHRPQQQGNVFYCGSPERLSFNDEKISTGFYIHEIKSKKEINSEFIETPGRQFQTLQLDERDIQVLLATPDTFIKVLPWAINEEIIRVRYTCSEETNKYFNRRLLEKALYAAGAFYVTEIKAEIEKTTRTRAENATTEMGPAEGLKLWCQVMEVPENDQTELIEKAEKLIQEVNS